MNQVTNLRSQIEKEARENQKVQKFATFPLVLNEFETYLIYLTSLEINTYLFILVKKGVF